MRGLTKLDLQKLLEPENRGILLDLSVFFLNLTLMIMLTRLTKNLVHDAETDVSAKALIGLYFAGLFLLQPLGPILKRWSFHQESKFDRDSLAGCLLSGFMFFYLVMMFLISSTATIILTTEVIYEPGEGGEIGTVLILLGFVWSILNTVLIYRYFVRPKKPPQWKFLTTHRAAVLGDICMFLNVISLQILWNNLTTAESFWQHTLSTPLGRPGSFTDILGRFIVIGVLALLVYFPGRIFYLAEDRGRKIAWLTILLANLPLLLRAVLSAPR
jgi:hypothetical protein